MHLAMQLYMLPKADHGVQPELLHPEYIFVSSRALMPNTISLVYVYLPCGGIISAHQREVRLGDRVSGVYHIVLHIIIYRYPVSIRRKRRLGDPSCRRHVAMWEDIANVDNSGTMTKKRNWATHTACYLNRLHHMAWSEAKSQRPTASFNLLYVRFTPLCHWSIEAYVPITVLGFRYNLHQHSHSAWLVSTNMRLRWWREPADFAGIQDAVSNLASLRSYYLASPYLLYFPL